MQRFWDKVDKTETCWNWTACLRGKSGYGCIRYQGKVYDAHRFVWFLTYGSFPKDCVLHRCDNRRCVRPDHLFEGTLQDNVRDMVSKGRHFTKPHGQGNKYSKGCRCDLCREERMIYQKAYRLRKRLRSASSIG